MNRLVKMVVVIVLGVLVTNVTNAQPRMGQGYQRGPANGQGFAMLGLDLTEDQQTQIKDLHLKVQKETLSLRNKLNENMAKLRTLQTSDAPDMKAINKLIDQNAGIRAEMAKLRAATHQEVRKVLTEEQRVIFDSNRGPRNGFNKGRGGQGPCMRMGNPGQKQGTGFRRPGRNF
ncbi:MAG: Spy/CpxP family protein refolding chaperone [Bacteroidota bacterium]